MWARAGTQPLPERHAGPGGLTGMGMPPNMQMPQMPPSMRGVDPKLVKQQSAKDPAPRKLGRRPNVPGEKKGKDSNAAKSPTIKRPREIHYCRLALQQLHFQGNELKQEEEPNHDDPPYNIPDIDVNDNEEDEQDADKNDAEGKSNAGDQVKDSQADKEAKKAGEEAEQIDSTIKPAEDSKEEETAVDDRAEEAHDEYVKSEHEGEADTGVVVDPYEGAEPLIVELNSKFKAKCLKRAVLDKKKESLKKANVLLYVQTKDK